MPSGNRIFRTLRAIAKRHSPEKLKAWVIDYENRRHGEFLHEYDGAYRSRINDYVESYCAGGSILDLGCSDGHVAFSLDPEKYEYYLGVDLSAIAIERAIEKHAQADKATRNHFVIGDIYNHEPDRDFNVILFKDSIYYANSSKILKCCSRLREKLRDGGAFIVHMDNVKRHKHIQQLIHENFHVIEENNDLDPTGVLIIFR